MFLFADLTNICSMMGIEPVTFWVAGGCSPIAPQRSSSYKQTLVHIKPRANMIQYIRHHFLSEPPK